MRNALHQRFVSSLLVAALLAPSFARATAEPVLCKVAVDADAARNDLRESLNLDLSVRKDRKIDKKIQKMNFETSYTENDLRLLVRKLFTAKMGPEITFTKDLLKPAAELTDERISRALSEEVASRGLLKFFGDNEKFRKIDRPRTLLFEVTNNPKFQIAMFLYSLATVHMPVPIVYLPHFLPVRPTELQLETLLLFGKDSEQGQAILRELEPKFRSNNHRFLFIKAFNNVAFMAVILMWLLVEEKQAEAESNENGERFVEQLTAKIDKIQSHASKVSDTENDHLYDIVSTKIEATQGPLSPHDHQQICDEIKAPHRCEK